jgi:hypothetical protein
VKDEPSWLRASCAGCGSSWYGLDRAHCGWCHRSFDTVDLFDAHRVDDLCINPAAVGLVKHQKSGIWEEEPAERRRSTKKTTPSIQALS